jgi:probable blue pigment (indigoidine) exporter
MENRKIVQFTLLTALAPIFWGTTYIVTTELLPAGRPFIASVIRVLPAGVMLVLLAGELPARKDVLKICILSALNIGFFQAMLFVAAYLLPGGVAAVAGSVQPLMIMLFVWLLDRQKPMPLALLIAVIAVCGMSLMMVQKGVVLSSAGLAAAFGGALSMALGTYFSAKWRVGLGNMSFTGWQLLIGGLMLVPVAAYYEDLPRSLTLNNLIGYAYLSFFGTLVAYYIWFNGIKRLPPVAVSVLGLLSPVTAVAAGWIFLGQNLNGVRFFGFITVIVCIALMQIVSRRG